MELSYVLSLIFKNRNSENTELILKLSCFSPLNLKIYFHVYTLHSHLLSIFSNRFSPSIHTTLHSARLIYIHTSNFNETQNNHQKFICSVGSWIENRKIRRIIKRHKEIETFLSSCACRMRLEWCARCPFTQHSSCISLVFD